MNRNTSLCGGIVIKSVRESCGGIVIKPGQFLPKRDFFGLMITDFQNGSRSSNKSPCMSSESGAKWSNKPIFWLLNFIFVETSVGPTNFRPIGKFSARNPTPPRDPNRGPTSPKHVHPLMTSPPSPSPNRTEGSHTSQGSQPRAHTSSQGIPRSLAKNHDFRYIIFTGWDLIWAHMDNY